MPLHSPSHFGEILYYIFGRTGVISWGVISWHEFLFLFAVSFSVDYTVRRVHTGTYSTRGCTFVRYFEHYLVLESCISYA